MAEGELPRSTRDRIVDVLLTQHGADRGVAGAQAFGCGDDVRDDRKALRGKPVASAPDAGDDLVETDQKAVPLATLRKPLPERIGRAIGRQGGGADGLAEV